MTAEYIYTTGEVAKICGVCMRTVCKWIDSGKLKGHTIPGSDHRRVTEKELVSFMAKIGIPMPDDWVPKSPVEIAKRPSNFPQDSAVFFKDGSHWCCVRPDFINLQESITGFGLTFKEAFDDLIERESLVRPTPLTPLTSTSSVNRVNTDSKTRTTDESGEGSRQER